MIYALLLASLALSWRVAGVGFSDFAPAAARLLLTITLTLPLLFGGIAFSTEVKTRTAISGALSANLLGAMLGGFLEYNSMVLGFEALWGIAFGAYALAALASLRAR